MERLPRIHLSSNLLHIFHWHALHPVVLNHEVEQRSLGSVLHHNAHYASLYCKSKTPIQVDEGSVHACDTVVDQMGVNLRKREANAATSISCFSWSRILFSAYFLRNIIFRATNLLELSSRAKNTFPIHYTQSAHRYHIVLRLTPS